MRVLHVEDDPIFRRLLDASLADSGIEARGESTLKDGLDALSSGPFDALVLDLELPDSSASNTVAALMGVRAFFGGAIVLCSGHFDDSVRAAAHIDAFLPKTEAHRAASAIADALQRRNRGQAISGSIP